MKVLTKNNRLYPTNDLHANNKILKINEIYKMKILLFVHDCLNKNIIPLFHNYFQLQTLFHNYQTRNTYLVKQPRAKTNMYHSSIKCAGASLWNRSPIAQRNIKLSKATLKMKLTQSYLNDYR